MAQSLTTPVVSVATPSLLAPFSSMQTAYNTGETAKATESVRLHQNLVKLKVTVEQSKRSSLHYVAENLESHVEKREDLAV